MAKAQQAPQAQEQPQQQLPTPPKPVDQHQQVGAQVLPQMLDRVTEYTPFLGGEKIRLTERMVLEYLCTPTKSGQVCSVRDARKFIMLCKSKGLNPWEGDAYLIGYDGKDGPSYSLITAHQAFLKRAEVHQEYDGMKSGLIVRRGAGASMEYEGDLLEEGDTLVGGWAEVYFKTRKYPMKRRLALSVFHKGHGRWQIDPGGMITKCAEADALRSSFPNELGGMYLDDEMPAIEGKATVPDGPPVGVNVDMRAKQLPSRPAPVQVQAQPEAEPEPAPPGSSDAPAPAPAADGEDAMARNDAISDYKSQLAEITKKEDATPILASIFKAASWLGTAAVEDLTKFSELKIAELSGKKPTAKQGLGDWSN